MMESHSDPPSLVGTRWKRPDPPEDFTGLWVVTGPDGHRRETEYVLGKPHGNFRQFLPNGQVVREGTFAYGQYHGDMVVRSSSGAILNVSRFVAGTGIYRIYMSSGELGWEIPLKSGKRHGQVKRWSKRGELISCEEFVDGVRQVPP